MIKYDYRNDIDGLRAIAVISVLLFHGGFDLFSGGYVGVDIFFVISGYLITSLILREKNNNNFSLINFYERRTRRIIPALLLTTLISTVISLLVMPPNLLVEFAKSIISVPLFISNFLFLSLDGYFATASEEVPLLHTWSLAVEEQYYLIFPIFILIFWKFGKKFLIFSIFLTCILGLCLAQFGGNINPDGKFYLEDELTWNAIPDFAFYFTPTRAWEILIGALIAFYLIDEKYLKNKNKNINNVLSLIGTFLIFFSIIYFDSSTPFPGIYTLIPTLGTAILIICSTKDTYIYKILSIKPLVGIGLISYSTYLWHQPILAYSRIIKSNALSNFEVFLLLLLSIFIGYISWKFIETPFRNKKIINRKYIFSLTLFSSLLIIVIGFVIIFNNGFQSRYTKDELKLVEPRKFDFSVCRWSNPVEQFPNIAFCNIGHDDESDPIIFYGDSHMDSLINSLDNQLKVEKLKGIKIFNNYCEPLVFFYRNKNITSSNQKICSDSHNALLDYVASIKPKNLFLLFRWTFRLYPIEELIESLTFNNQEGGVEYVKHYRKYYGKINNEISLSYEAKINSLNQFINSFKIKNLKTTILYPIPEAGWNLPKYNNTKIIFNKDISEIMSTNYNLYLDRNKFILTILDNIIEDELIDTIKSQNLFCNTFIKNRCIIQINNEPLYYDYDHLSFSGAELITRKIIENIIKQH